MNNIKKRQSVCNHIRYERKKSLKETQKNKYIDKLFVIIVILNVPLLLLLLLSCLVFYAYSGEIVVLCA